jgi:hypothetical protein
MADQFSQNDVDSLGEKLEHFSQSLTSGEQAALFEILYRAAPQDGDVQGFQTLQTPKPVTVLVKGAIRPNSFGR